jgi:hypothetical protein
MASIRLDHVTKIYAGETPAVNDVPSTSTTASS